MFKGVVLELEKKIEMACMIHYKNEFVAHLPFIIINYIGK